MKTENANLSIRDVDKNDALMSNGLAILSMLILHLFCRTGVQVYGTPLIWLDEKTPLVYWFGFFAEVCVTLYSLRGGYGVFCQGQSGKLSFKIRALRCLKLMEVYWIVDILFCLLGLLFDKSGQIPGSLSDFLKSLILLHSYNGAWWYLSTYVIISLFFSKALYELSLKTDFLVGISACIIIQAALYFNGKFDIIPSIESTNQLVKWIETQIHNLPGPLTSFFAGCLLCRYRIIALLREKLQNFMKPQHRNLFLLGLFVIDFLAINIIHKAILTFINGLIIFALFNLWEKEKTATTVFMFLGKHSTVIWLSHMFFYLYIFEGLVQKARLPVLMLLFMLALTIISSYVVEGIKLLINKVTRKMVKWYSQTGGDF